MTTKFDLPKRWSPNTPGFYLIVFVVVSVTGVIVAGAGSGGWGGAAVAAVAGIGSFMVGGFVGFLFGIPRYASAPAERSSVDASTVKYQANTNLEQISDWLTKIIVGVGLTQFRAIGGWVHDVAIRLAAGLAGGGTTSNDEALAMGLLLLTAVCGFLFFYLWSRVYLPQIFKVAEQEG